MHSRFLCTVIVFLFPLLVNSLMVCGANLDANLDAIEHWLNYAGSDPGQRAFDELSQSVAEGQGTPRAEVLAYRAMYANRMVGRTAAKVALLRDAAAKGYAPAQARLGWAEVGGQTPGISRALVDGERLIQDALRQGRCLAMKSGAMFSPANAKPQTVGPEAASACEHFRKAGNAGRNQSWRYLALVEVSLGRTTDAIHDLQRGADAGDGQARLALGSWYEFGRFVPRDLVLALKWYLAATADSQALTDSAKTVGEFYMRNANFPNAAEKSFEWLSRAADAGDLDAKFNVAYCKLSGTGTQMDIPGGLTLLRSAATAGQADALVALGRYQLSGILIPRDVSAARKSFELAAQRGNEMAQLYLRWMSS